MALEMLRPRIDLVTARMLADEASGRAFATCALVASRTTDAVRLSRSHSGDSFGRKISLRRVGTVKMIAPSETLREITPNNRPGDEDAQGSMCKIDNRQKEDGGGSGSRGQTCGRWCWPPRASKPRPHGVPMVLRGGSQCRNHVTLKKMLSRA
jgi:hypothetical protein